MNSPKKTIYSLLWVIFFDQACLSMTFPVLTLLFFDSQSRLFSPDTSQAVRSMWYGLCIAIPSLMNIFITPVLSAISDVFGRRKILLIEIFGALIFSLTAAFGVFGGMLTLLIFGLMIKGAFARVNPTAQAIMGDISPKEKKVLYMGYLQFAVSMGAFIGPLMGGYLANRYFFSTLNFSLPYFISAILAIFSSLLAWVLIKETLPEKKSSHWKTQLGFTALKQILLNPNVLRISLILLLSQISWSIYYQFMPPILKTVYHFDSHQLGLFVGLVAFWLAMATGVGIKALERFFNLRQLLLISLYLVLIGLIMSFVACIPQVGLGDMAVWLGAAPTAIGDVIAYTCLTALYSDAVAKQSQGKAMAVCFIVVSAIWALTGLIGGMLMSYSTILPLIIAPLGILFSIGLMHAEFGNKLAWIDKAALI